MFKNWLTYKRVLLVLLILVALAIPARSLLLGKAVATLSPQRQAVQESVISSGRVITPMRVELGSELVGHVVEVAVEEGDRVRAGQVLARLRDDELRAALDQTRRGVEEAQARIAQLREVARPVAEQGLLQAQANLAQAQAEYERIKTLAGAGFYNQSRLDEAQRALEGARAARESAVVQARGNRPEGVENRLAEARLAQSRAALNVAEAQQGPRRGRRLDRRRSRGLGPRTRAQRRPRPQQRDGHAAATARRVRRATASDQRAHLSSSLGAALLTPSPLPPPPLLVRTPSAGGVSVNGGNPFHWRHSSNPRRT